jgi:hypothetical protein
MAVFIELTANDRARKSGPFLVNVDSIKVIYQGSDGAVVHLDNKVSIEVKERYDELKRLISLSETAT